MAAVQSLVDQIAKETSSSISPTPGLITQTSAPAAPAAPASSTPAPATAPATPESPLTTTPPASTPAGMTLQTTTGVNTAGQTYSPTAYTQAVDPTKTTQGLLTQVLDKGGELMRIAGQRGENLATRRGMGNSSIAAQASMGAMLDQALPIATADAQLHQQQALQNQSAMNAAAGVSNEFLSSDMKMRQEQELKRLTASLTNSSVGSEYQSKFISQYMDGVNAVLNNKDMTSEQKSASINKMYENLQGSIALQASVSGVDFSKYKPGGATGGTTTPAPGTTPTTGTGGLGAPAAPVGGTGEQQLQFLRAQNVGQDAINYATSLKMPLLRDDGSFVVLAKKTSRLGGSIPVAAYYNPKTGSYTYTYQNGQEVPSKWTELMQRELFTGVKDRPWTGIA